MTPLSTPGSSCGTVFFHLPPPRPPAVEDVVNRPALSREVEPPRLELVHGDPAQLAQQAVSKAQAAADTAIDTPSVTRVPSSQTTALAKCQAFARKFAQAERADVDLARANFMSKLLGLGVSAVAFVVAVSLTSLSLGACAPLLAVTSARLLIAVGDAYCAGRTFKESRETPPRKTLPMGANSLANVLHFAAIKAGSSPEKAKRLATVGSAVVGVGLGVAGLALGMALGGTAIEGRGLRLAGAALQAMVWPVDAHYNDRFDETATSKRRAGQEAVREVKALYLNASNEAWAALGRELERLPEFAQCRSQLLELLKQGAEPLAMKRERANREVDQLTNRLIANVAREVGSLNSAVSLSVGLLLLALSH